MTPEELNSYRFTSYDDPTDEMLEAIMHEAGEEVRHNNAICNQSANLGRANQRKVQISNSIVTY